jgi:hypothetical protein
VCTISKRAQSSFFAFDKLKKMLVVDYKLDPDGPKKMSNEIAKKNSQNIKTQHG